MQELIFIKNKLRSGDYTILPSSIAIGYVYKISEYGNLDKDGFETSFLYISKDSGIKKHFHNYDIEKYKKIIGTLCIDGKLMDNNVCLLGESHSIDIVNTTTIVHTYKISRLLLQQINSFNIETDFEKIIKTKKIHR